MPAAERRLSSCLEGRTRAPDAKIQSLPKKDSSGFCRVGRRVKGEGELRLR